MLTFLQTLGWLACVIYATIPSFWLVIHPRVDYWRSRRSPYLILVPTWIGMWILLGVLTSPWRQVALYSSLWAWIPAAILLATGLWIYLHSGKHFSRAQLGGVPELIPEHREQRLVTAGIRARVRHPVYLGHLCEMLAWSVGTELVVGYGLTAFALLTGAVMIRLEDQELERRFGAEYRRYKRNVPALIPKGGHVDPRPKLSVIGDVLHYESHGQPMWNLGINDIVCLSEYTTTQGPWADDYFLVFLTKSNRYYEASFYSDGRDELLGLLSERWDAPVNLELSRSTQFASRVVWPVHVRDLPFFVGNRTKTVSAEVSRLAAASR